MNAFRSPLIWIPSLIIVLLVGGYTVYWQTLAGDVLDGVVAWAEERRAEGMNVSFAGARMTGFPFRMDLEIETLNISDPQHPNDWSWTGEKVDVALNPFQLSRINAHFLGEHQLTYTDRMTAGAAGRNELRSTAENARLALTLGRDKVKRIFAEIDDWQGQFKASGKTDFVPVSAKTYRMQLETAPQEGSGQAAAAAVDTLDTQTLVMQIEELVLPSGTFPPLGDNIRKVEARTHMRNLPADFQRADDCDDAMRRWADRDGSLDIEALHMVWGDLDLTAEGEISLDRQYRPQGAITTLAGGYNAVIDGLYDQGQLDETLASLIKSALNLLALTGKDPKGRLQIPLDMRGGFLFLGPLKLTDLPPVVSPETR